jgi:hypothetical protein
VKGILSRTEERVVRGLDLDQAEWDRGTVARREDKRQRRRARRRLGRLLCASRRP